MNLLDNTQPTEIFSTIWLANVLVSVVLVVLVFLAVARYFSVV
jgi:hypothetical protein